MAKTRETGWRDSTRNDSTDRLTIKLAGVTFTLDEQGDEVLLTIVHRRVEDHEVPLNVSAGWHSHVDVLEANLRGTAPVPHCANFAPLRAVSAESSAVRRVGTELGRTFRPRVAPFP